MAKLNLSEIPLDAGDGAATAVVDEKVPHGTKVMRDELEMIELEIEDIGDPYALPKKAGAEYATLLEKQKALRQQAEDMRSQIDLAIQAKQRADEHANKVIVPHLNELTKRRGALRKHLGLDKA